MASRILIHKGPIRKVFVNNVVLNKEHVEPIIADVISREDALFYSKMKKLITVEDNMNFFTKDEAMDYIYQVLKGGNEVLLEYLHRPNVTEEEAKKFLTALRMSTACLYVNPEETRPAFAVTRNEFKILQKRERERGN